MLALTTSFDTVAKAQALADRLNADDEEGWTYKVIPDPNGGPRAIIHIFDETGEFLAQL